MPRHLISIDYEIKQGTIYVEKKFSGAAQATVTSTGITSTNPEYNAQLEVAQVGSTVYPFPCLWSAKRKALELQADGVESVEIIAVPNYQVTIGSPVLTQNGTVGVSLTENEQPDIMVANVEADLRAFSIAGHNIHYIFGHNSKVINICKAYAIKLMWANGIATDYRTSVSGEGTFIWIYGQVEGFQQFFADFYTIPKLHFTFSAEMILINMRWIFAISDFQYVNISLNKLHAYDCSFNVSNGFDWITAGYDRPLFILNINDYKRGRGLFSGLSAAANDYWSGISTASAYPYDAHIHLKNVRINQYYGVDDPSLLSVSGEFLRNNIINLTIDNLHHTFVPGAVSTSSILQLLRARVAVKDDSTGLSDNHVNVHIKNAICQGTIGAHPDCMSSVRDSKITYQLDNYIHMPTGDVTDPSAIRLTYYGVKNHPNNQFLIRGNITNYAIGPIFNNWNWTSPTTEDALAVRFEDCTFVQKTDGQPVIDLTGASPFIQFSLKNCTLANDGVTDTITNDAATTVLTEGLTVNGPLNANITTVGTTPSVVPTLRKYIKR